MFLLVAISIMTSAHAQSNVESVWLKKRIAAQAQVESSQYRCGEILEATPNAFRIDPTTKNATALDTKVVFASMKSDVTLQTADGETLFIGEINPSEMALINKDLGHQVEYVAATAEEASVLLARESQCLTDLIQRAEANILPKTAIDVENRAVLAKNQILARQTQSVGTYPLLALAGTFASLGALKALDVRTAKLTIRNYNNANTRYHDYTSPISWTTKKIDPARARLLDEKRLENLRTLHDFKAGRRAVHSIGKTIAGVAVVTYIGYRVYRAVRTYSRNSFIEDNNLTRVLQMEDADFRKFIQDYPDTIDPVMKLASKY